MGVDGQLNILEPSMGTGHFYQLLPSSMRKSQLYGVELESVSGQIAKQLYPEAKIHITGFETADLKLCNVKFLFIFFTYYKGILGLFSLA